MVSMVSERYVPDLDIEDEIAELEEPSKDKIKGSLLMKYLKSAERPLMLVFLFASYLLAQILASGADMFSSYW